MAGKKKAAKLTDDKAVSEITASPVADSETTNVRRAETLESVITELNELAEADDNADRAFRIGDLVQLATKEHRQTVETLVSKVRLSRTRLCDCRTTAVAFAGESRKVAVPNGTSLISN